MIDHLKKNDLLPVVSFTFSRQKCDNNAANLRHLDLLNIIEKDHVKFFFNKSIRCLKEADRSIPQVIKMRDILCRGIGVHHSGILPIIKEIVEMLFQQGYIKVSIKYCGIISSVKGVYEITPNGEHFHFLLFLLLLEPGPV